MKLILLLLTTTAISAAQTGPLRPRTREAMCKEEIFAARMDGNKKREQYFRSFVKGPVDLTDAIDQLKASVPQKWKEKTKKQFLAAIDQAPLYVAMKNHGLFGQHIVPLIESGVDVCQASPEGNTPLMHASIEVNQWWVITLLAYGAAKNINVPNSAGLTALTHFYLAPQLDAKQQALIQTLLQNDAVAVEPSTLPETARKYVQVATVVEIQKRALAAAPKK